MLVRCLAMMRGGGETRHLAWARELTALGVEVDIITGGPLLVGAPRYEVAESADFPGSSVTMLRSPYARDFVYRFQHRRGFGRLTMAALHLDEEWFCRVAWRRIAARQGPRRPDVVHAHALHQAARLRTGAVGPLGNVPVVINLPGAPNPRYAADLREADALVADGWAADHLPATLGRTVERVPKGVDSERFQPSGSNRREALALADKRVILTVARLVPIKNVALLVDAIAILRKRVSGVHLLVVGEGPEAEALKRRAVTLDVSDAVTFVGYVPQVETPAFYRSGDVFGLSSDFDNSPNVVLEAMASGLPVVTTDVGGVREFVADRVGGAVVPAGDAGVLAAGLEKYLASAAAGREAGAYNRARATSEFSWRASALRLLDVYHRVIASRSGLGMISRASA
jgi:glycosyltransferase involved in cell wall biosynthesis